MSARISEEKARDLLTQMGYDGAADLSVGRIQEMLNDPATYKDREGGKRQRLFDGALSKLGEGKAIVIGDEEPASDSEEDRAMEPEAPAKKPRKKPSKNGTATKTKPVKAKVKKTPTKPAKERKKREGMSCVDAVAQVLQKSRKPMKVLELVESMAKQGLWSTSAGKTPEKSVEARIYVDMKTHGKKSRFKKAGRGLFAFNK